MVDVGFFKNGVAQVSGHRLIDGRHGLDRIPPRIAVTQQDGHFVRRTRFVCADRSESVILRAVNTDQSPELETVASMRQKSLTDRAVFSRKFVHIRVSLHVTSPPWVAPG